VKVRFLFVHALGRYWAADVGEMGGEIRSNKEVVGWVVRVGIDSACIQDSNVFMADVLPM
jgi:hypothetical protein